MKLAIISVWVPGTTTEDDRGTALIAAQHVENQVRIPGVLTYLLLTSTAAFP